MTIGSNPPDPTSATAPQNALTSTAISANTSPGVHPRRGLAQTAKLLRVNKNAVHCLRRRGRLTGWQKPTTKEHGFGHRCWFYKKDDVYNLLADGEYWKRNKRAKTVRS